MEPILILIVEDDEKSRRLMSDVLSHQGYQIAEAANAEDGLEIVRRDHPALVLMDIHLPGMSGLDALREIRRDASIRATRVLAVTASVMGNDRNKIRDAGFDGFEPKPINLRAFLQKVSDLIPPLAASPSGGEAPPSPA
jgi:two-component system cell cycle response regulator DivK